MSVSKSSWIKAISLPYKQKITVPLIVSILALAVFALLLQLMLRTRSSDRLTAQKDQQVKALEQRLEEMSELLAQVQKRLSNVEEIVTDSKFVDPPLTGREAIDLQAEIRALKDKLNRL